MVLVVGLEFAAKRSEIGIRATAVAWREYPFCLGATAATRKDCEHHQPTSVGGYSKLVATLELEGDQCPSHAPQSQNWLEVGVQNYDEEVEGELLT